jgi:hypothetical protein
VTHDRMPAAPSFTTLGGKEFKHGILSFAQDIVIYLLGSSKDSNIPNLGEGDKSEVQFRGTVLNT